MGAPRLNRDRVAGLLLILVLPMLVAGLVTPAISITRMVVFSDTYSIVGAVFAFLGFGGTQYRFEYVLCPERRETGEE